MSRAEVVEAFATFPVRLGDAVRAASVGSAVTSGPSVGSPSVGSPSAGRPAMAGEWGPAEVVRHLIAVEREVWQSRLASVAAEDDPHWAWTEPGLAPGFDDASLESIVDAFAAARATTVATVDALDETGWARHGIHATYGVLDVAGLLRLANDHDSEHLAGIA